MQTTIVVASKNKGKIQEIRQVLGEDLFEIKSMANFGIDIDITENGSSFEENAIIKAKAIYDILKIPALADDSGLCVDALNGQPGIYSARFSESGLDKDNNKKLLAVMKNISNRNAKFVSVIALVKGENDVVLGYGETDGKILDREEGENGFGYDPLFYSYDLKKTFGQASASEKNKVSHRYRALVDLLSKLKWYFSYNNLSKAKNFLEKFTKIYNFKIRN